MNRRDYWGRSGRTSSWIRRSLRLAIYLRDHFDCVHCNLVFPPAQGLGDLSLDHIIPRSIGGGGSDPRGLITACHACNYGRQDTSLTGRALARALKCAARPVDRAAGHRLLARMGRPCANCGAPWAVDCLPLCPESVPAGVSA